LSLSNKDIPIDLLSGADQLIIKKKNDHSLIFDPVRKKYIRLQPEEFVRQLFVLWLIQNTKINRNSIQVEKVLKINNVVKRFDILIYDNQMNPYIVVECKAPEVKITQSTFDQIAVYNMALSAPFLVVTNGRSTYIVQVNHTDKCYSFFDALPEW
jgi:hypothetical protein